MTGSITIAGREYISAVRASKKIGYSADYIGQLSRAKKIPAKLVGKTWYIDYDALSKYKKSKKLKETLARISEPVLEVKVVEKKQEVLRPPQPVRGNLSEVEKLKILNNVVIAYEKEDQPRLPEFYKKVESLPSRPVRKTGVRNHLVPIGFSLMLIFGLAVTKLENVSLAPLNSFYSSVSSSVSASSQPALLSSIAMWFENLFKNSDEESHLVQQAPDDASIQTSGIVVVPANDDHTGVVSRIKNAFSDDVEVSFDQSGDTGTITPVFRQEDDFENYAFVIVPLKNNSNNN